MKFSKLDLLTLLISLFLLSSCKDASTIGLNLGGNKITGVLLDTVTVLSNTIVDQPTSTYPALGTGIERYPLGYMKDPVFGVTTASLAMAVNLPGSPSATSFIVGPSPVIDSVVLVLPFDTASAGVLTSQFLTSTPYRRKEFYGDSTAIYNITVSQLTTAIKSYGGTYPSNQVYPSGDVLGTFSAAIKPNTHVKVLSIISGAKDTMVNNPPQLRIKLNAALIQSKILALDSLTLSTDFKFNTAFKGIKITATTTNANGGIMFLDFSTANSNLEIYYKHPDATTPTTVDTVYAKFPMLTTSNAVAATVTHDYTGTPVATQLATPGVYQTTYLQALSGIRNKISFPYLSTLKAKIGSNIVINKAELVIDTSDPADSIPFKIPYRLALYRLDIAGQRANLPDNNPYSSTNTGGDPRSAASAISYGGVYDYVKKSYTFTVTDYVQDIIDGKQIDYGTYLAPEAGGAALANATPYAVPTTAARVVIGAFTNTANRKIRLNIYYVKTSTL